MNTILKTAMIASAIVLMSQLPADAQLEFNEFFREVNDELSITIKTDRDSNVYQVGEAFQIRVRANKDVYIHIFNINPNGKTTLLFPNEKHKNNFIEKDREHVFPEGLELEAVPPVGQEQICCLASTAPLNLTSPQEQIRFQKFLDSMKFESSPQESLDALKSFVLRVRNEYESEWSGLAINLMTTDSEGPKLPIDEPEQPTGKRFFIGFAAGSHADGKIPNIKSPNKDLKLIESAFETWGFECESLMDRDTTQSQVQSLLQETAFKSKPGDTIVMYFSGIGVRSAVTPDVEDDGSLESLLLFDSQLGTSSSYLGEDEVGKWLELMYDRHLIILVDACFDSGKGATIRGLPQNKITASPPDHTFSPSSFVAPNLANLVAEFSANPFDAETVEQKNQGLFSTILADALGQSENATLLEVLNNALNDQLFQANPPILRLPSEASGRLGNLKRMN